VLTLLIALLLAVPAQAAPPWAAPVNASTDPFAVRYVPPSHLFSGTVSRPALYGASRAVVTVVNDNGLFVSFGRTDGKYGTAKRITARDVSGVQLAANANGDVVVAWFEDRGVYNDRVYIAFRPSGKPFTPPILQATDRVRSVSIAVSPTGGLLLAYDARGVVKTRYKRAGAPLFGRVQALESEPTLNARLRTAMTANGRAYVAWAADGFYQAAVRTVGSGRFRAAQVLEQAAPTGGLDLVVDDSNRATVAWGGSTVRAAVTDATATFGAAQDIAPGAEGALTSTSDGRRLVAFKNGDTLLAALAPAAGAFGAPETVTTTADAPYAAFDGTGNRWWLVWGATTPRASQRPAG
jgi:hypothetical protein